MKYRISPEVSIKLREIKHKNKELFVRIQKQLHLFSLDSKHPSLRAHKLSGTRRNIWSISISMKVRMLYVIISSDEVYFADIGTHDQVYRKK